MEDFRKDFKRCLVGRTVASDSEEEKTEREDISWCPIRSHLSRRVEGLLAVDGQWDCSTSTLSVLRFHNF